MQLRPLSIAAMSFFSVLVALLLEQVRPLPHPSVFELWFVRYANRLSRDLNAGQPLHGTVGWLLGVLPWMAIVLLGHRRCAACRRARQGTRPRDALARRGGDRME